MICLADDTIEIEKDLAEYGGTGQVWIVRINSNSQLIHLKVLNDGRPGPPQISHLQLDCILTKSDDHVEAARVGWALDQLTAAMNARLAL